jgi:hypothetical protein
MRTKKQQNGIRTVDHLPWLDRHNPPAPRTITSEMLPSYRQPVRSVLLVVAATKSDVRRQRGYVLCWLFRTLLRATPVHAHVHGTYMPPT